MNAVQSIFGRIYLHTAASAMAGGAAFYAYTDASLFWGCAALVTLLLLFVTETTKNREIVKSVDELLSSMNQRTVDMERRWEQSSAAVAPVIHLHIGSIAQVTVAHGSPITQTTNHYDKAATARPDAHQD